MAGGGSNVSTPHGGDTDVLLVPEANGGGGYDAVAPSTMRGYIYWPQLDTRKEVSSFTRIEIMKRGRALCANMGLPAHIIEGLADLLGYLTPLGLTGDAEWNREANANFRDSQEEPEVFDASGKFGFSEYQNHLNQGAFRDGDLLPVLTESATGRARVATYEAHQVATPYGSPSSLDGWMDGVRLNRFNKHMAYSLVDPADRTRAVTVNARDAIYYGHFRKQGHVRPVSILHGAINHLVDMAEIVRDVKYGIKVRNQIPLSLETEAGSNSFTAGSTQALVGNVLSKSTATTDANGAASTVEVKAEQVLYGGNIPRLGPGQSLKAIIDAAPHPNQLALLDWMVRDISWGCGLPPEILWDINSLRGANNRLLSSMLQRWIGARLMRQRYFVRRFWVYHCAKEMKAGRLRECRDPQWWKVAMLPQASLTADKGKEGKLNIDLVANRMMSLQDYFALEGKFWLDELRQLSAEEKECRELGLAVADVARGRVKAKEEEEDLDEDDEEEDEKKKGPKGGE